MAGRARVRDNPRAKKKLAYWARLCRASWLPGADNRTWGNDNRAKRNKAMYAWAINRYAITTALEGPKDVFDFTICQQARNIIRSFKEPQTFLTGGAMVRLFAETESQEIRDMLAKEIRAQRGRSAAENEAIYQKLLHRKWAAIGEIP